MLTSTQDLSNFVAAVLSDGIAFIAVDCEFVRQTTYRPLLGLIQMATTQDVVLIDPLAPGLDLSVLKPLLTHPPLTKVFHSGRQDIEIFYHLFQECPAPLFDTQIAAAFVGLGEGIGYEKLVKDILGLTIDKAEQYTDWLQRPLTDNQLNYALHDVLYLRQIYPLLCQRLERLNRQEWPLEEFAYLSNPELYKLSPEKAWQKINLPKGKWQALSLLWDLAAWREQYAYQANLSRNILADNRLLTNLCQHPFLTVTPMQEWLKDYRQQILNQGCFDDFYACYQQAFTFLQTPSPALDQRKQDIKNYLQQHSRNPLNSHQKQQVLYLRKGLQAIADTLNLPLSYLANRRDLESFVRHATTDHKLTKGWRRNLVDDFLSHFRSEN